MGDLVPISAAPSYDGELTILDAGGRPLDARAQRSDTSRPAPEGYVRRDDMVEHRVKLTREEFAKVAAGTYPAGQEPEHGAPTIVDKRGARNPLAAERRAEREARAAAEAAQSAWAHQAAGTMFWQAQGFAQRGRAALATRVLAKRQEIVNGAVRQGIW